MPVSDIKSGLQNLRAIIFISLLALTLPNSAAAVSLTPEQVAAKEQEIKDINQKIETLRGQRDTTVEEAQNISQEIKKLEASLKKAQIDIQETELTIKKVKEKQVLTGQSITDIQKKREQKRQELRALMRLLYEKEQSSLIAMFLDNWSLSEVFREQATYKELQQRAAAVVSELRQEEATLEVAQENLENEEQDLSQLENLLTLQQAEINQQKQEQATYLKAKEEEKAQYEHKIAEADRARKEIEQQIFKIEGASGVEIKLENAYDMARYANSVTGVRPSLLLGVLRIESNVGQSIGTGTFPDDMQPQSREAFLRITQKLGLDPATAQISRRPASGKGWGGAMGPAQIMPATWEGIEPRLEQLLKKSPANPYELTDAFVATAVFLADRGAANPASEREAVGRYIAGPNWEYYSWYIDKVMAVAKEYQANGLE